MLVRITNSCQMCCKHCMVDATPDGEHMTREVYEQTIKFILSQGFPIILMSGGEPTDHPDIVPFIRYASNMGIYVTLLSNGEFLHDKPEMRDAILDKVHAVQVTNDPAFYPRYVEPFHHHKVLWETQLRQVSPHGRARTNKLRTNRTAPECFNIRSLTRALGSFASARLSLIGRGKMCTPSVNVDGSISAGEAPGCTKIGYVTDDDSTIEHNIRLMRCSRCGLVDNLDREHQRAIGEAVLIVPGEK